MCVRVIAEDKSFWPLYLGVYVRVHVHAFENQALRMFSFCFQVSKKRLKDYRLPLLSKYMCHVAMVFRIPPYDEFSQYSVKIWDGHVRMTGKQCVCSPNIHIQINIRMGFYVGTCTFF